MKRTAPAGPTLIRLLAFGGLAALAAITLVHPGATRMYAWPWTLALAAAVLAPALLVLVRSFSRSRPLALPSPAWLSLIVASALVLLVSAIASPHRGPALRWSAPLLGGLAWFLVVFDWLHSAPDSSARIRNLLTLLTLFLGVAAFTSLGQWLVVVLQHGIASALAARNAYPLGHSNYTAGLGLLLLPGAAAAAWQHRGLARAIGLASVVAALALVFTSGSRGGALGLAALVVMAGLTAPFPWRKKLPVVALLLISAFAIAAANPRFRAIFASDPTAPVSLSNLQRSAMLGAGLRMGADRPLLGWGPGTTPLVFPRYRALLAGGAENVLQLHSAPAHLWAELGAAGVACALAAIALAFQNRRRAPAAALTLFGYGAFALTDWQLDVPVFGVAVAVIAAMLASPARPRASSHLPRLVGACTLGALASIALLGRPDPTPELNVRALAVVAEKPAQAVALLRESLALNPYQELPHTNLGWLLVASDPVAAESHFRAAARFVPDKGSIYFGLGLAALNQSRPDTAARAFAFECLNHPAFLSSPYWREPAIAALRERSLAAFLELCRRAAARVPPDSWTAAQLARLAIIAPTHLGRVTDAPERAFRRERTGYPILVRNLDLPPPLDVFVDREIIPASSALSSASSPSPALPLKGWLPSPLLLALLDDTVSPTP